MSSLATLKNLDLSCNPIRLDGLCHLLGKQTKLRNLEELELYSCSIQAPKDIAKCINKQFAELGSLSRLNLSHNNLSGLIHLISGPLKLFQPQLETLLMVEVNQD